MENASVEGSSGWNRKEEKGTNRAEGLVEKRLMSL